MINKQIGVSLNEIELEMVDHFISEKGRRSRSEVLREALRFYHDKIFPAYIQSKKQKIKEIDELQKLKDSMTNEQYCEYLGGHVQSEGTSKICFLPFSPETPNNGVAIDLDIIKSKNKK
jgi:Arc/MetJ-type ribon-helix-helix transcriptional regulator